MFQHIDFNKNDYEEITDLSIAIDYCTSIFIFLDLNNHVTYLNFKALEFFCNNDSYFQYYDEDFNPHQIMGNNIKFFDDIIKNHKELLNIKAGQDYSFIENIGKSNLHVKMKFSPIYNNYKQIGLCLEISDISHLAKAHELFKKAMMGAKSGDFSNRIDFKTFSSDDHYFNDIFQDINDLFENTEYFFQDLQVGLENISTGNLNYCLQINHQDIETNTFEAIKQDLNYTSDKLRTLVTHVHEISEMMNQMISQLMAKNSEVAMTMETEFVDAEQNKQELDQHISVLKNNSSKIEQATSIIDLTHHESNQIHCVEELKETVVNMGGQIRDISDVALAMERFFSIHMNGLKNGLTEINQGSLGKGIGIIQLEVQEIMHKSDDAMQEIQRSLAKLEKSFIASNYTIDELLKVIFDDMSNMEKTIKMLGDTIKLIQDLVYQQDKTFGHFEDLTTKIDHLRQNTMTNIESMIIATSNLVTLSGTLEHSIHCFEFEKNLKNFNPDILSDDNDLQDEKSIVFLWD